MSCPIIEVYCDKCGSKIKHMIILKSLKDILRPTKYKCSSCGQTLNPMDFSIELEKLWFILLEKRLNIISIILWYWNKD